MASNRLHFLSVSLLLVGGCSVVLAHGPGLPRGVRECYENTTLYARHLRIPSTVGALAALVDRIERIPNLNMDMRTLSSSLVHRFRTDGVERDPTVMSNSGVIPFATSGFQTGRQQLLTEKLLPGNALNFPNTSLSGEERCAMHFMLSSTVDKWERNDEGSVCSQLQQFRTFRGPRAALDKELTSSSEVDDLAGDDGKSARQYQMPPESSCPIEDGVVWTPWGAVSASTLMSGIATGLQRQEVTINQMAFKPRSGESGVIASLENTGPISNLYAATFSGDLGEAVLRQGPRSQQINIGGSGGWNNTALPKHYFLSKNENFEMSDAEIRGGLDGLIIGMGLQDLQSALGNRLTLSQVLEMYYSERGFPTQRNVRACQRREHLARVAPTDELTKQTRSIIPALQHYIISHTIDDPTMDTFINSAVSRLLAYIPSSLNDKACEIQETNPQPTERLGTPAIDLYIVVDPTWNYDDALPTLAALLREIPPHAAGSSLTLYVGSNNDVAMVNYTRSILDFYGNFTAENYRFYMSTQLEVARSLTQLSKVFAESREVDKRLNRAGGRSQVVLFIAHTATGASDEQSKLFLQNEARVFREASPDVRLLFLCSGNKERFRDLVLDPDRDLFTLPPLGFTGTPDVKEIVTRLSELPARLTNPACGAKWEVNEENNGGGQQMHMYADPMGIRYYRLMPNYFFHSKEIKVRLQGQGQGRLNVCYSRTNDMPKSSGDPGQGSTTTNGVTCRQLNSDTAEFIVEKPCDGAHYAIDCKPLYFSAVAIESSNRCNTPVSTSVEDGCRYPDLARFIVTAEGLGCHSGASLGAATSALLLAGALLALLCRS